jgi:hypothetical protein
MLDDLVPRWRPSDEGVRLLGMLAVAVMLASVTAHLLSFLNKPPPLWWAWPIHGLIFIPFVAMILVQLGRRPRVQRCRGETYFAWLRRANEANRDAWSQILGALTPRQKALCVAVFAYAAVNFLAFMRNTVSGKPPEALLIRGFSGHWIFFSFIPSVYFLWVEPRLRVGGPTAN